MTREKPGGPHTKPMMQVNFALDAFREIVSWLMLNRRGLSVLVHPETGDDVADHGDFAVWLGEPVAIDFDAVREFMERRREREREAAAG